MCFDIIISHFGIAQKVQTTCKGSIFSTTSEYLICAFTQAAIGAAATDTRAMLAASKDADFFLMSFATFFRSSPAHTIATYLIKFSRQIFPSLFFQQKKNDS